MNELGLYINKSLLITLIYVNYVNMGIGDWGLGIGPNPQSPIPNPQLYVISTIFKY